MGRRRAATRRVSPDMLGVKTREPALESVPACPGCGYPVGAARGVPGSQQTGVCSECGLEFSWSEIEDPSLREVSWFVEHGRGGEGRMRDAWRVTCRAIVTFWRVMTLGLWREVTPGVRASPRRMVMWWLMVIGGMHAIASLLSMGRVVWLLRGSWGAGAPAGSLTTLGFVQQVMTCWVYPVVEGFEWWTGGASSLSALPLWTIMGWPTEVIAAIVGHTTAALMSLVLVASRRRLGVSAVDVLRAWVYGWAWLAVLAAFRAVRNVVVLVAVVWERSVGAAASLPSGGVQVRFGGARPLFIFELPVGVVWVVTCGWLMAWWYVTVRQGWRAARPVWFWLAIAVPSVLVGVGAVILRDGYFWHW